MAFRPHPLDLRRTLAPPGPAQSPALSDDACSVASMPPVHGREESYGQRQVASSSSSPYLDDNDDDLDLSPHSLPSQGIKTARPPLPPLPLTRRHTTSNVPTQSHVHREEHKPAYSPPTVPLARMEASDKGKERSLEPQQPRSTPSPAHPSPALVATTDDDADETTTVVSALPVYERDGDVPPVPTWPNEKEPATSQPSPPLPAPPTTSTEPQQGTQHAVERWREATAQEARRSDEAERALAPEFGRRAPSSQSTDSGRSRGYRLERGASMRHESGRRRGSGASRSAMTEAEIAQHHFRLAQQHLEAAQRMAAMSGPSARLEPGPYPLSGRRGSYDDRMDPFDDGQSTFGYAESVYESAYGGDEATDDYFDATSPLSDFGPRHAGHHESYTTGDGRRTRSLSNLSASTYRAPLHRGHIPPVPPLPSHASRQYPTAPPPPRRLEEPSRYARSSMIPPSARSSEHLDSRRLEDDMRRFGDASGHLEAEDHLHYEGEGYASTYSPRHRDSEPAWEDYSRAAPAPPPRRRTPSPSRHTPEIQQFDQYHEQRALPATAYPTPHQTPSPHPDVQSPTYTRSPLSPPDSTQSADFHGFRPRLAAPVATSAAPPYRPSPPPPAPVPANVPAPAYAPASVQQQSYQHHQQVHYSAPPPQQQAFASPYPQQHGAVAPPYSYAAPTSHPTYGVPQSYIVGPSGQPIPVYSAPVVAPQLARPSTLAIHSQPLQFDHNRSAPSTRGILKPSPAMPPQFQPQPQSLQYQHQQLHPSQQQQQPQQLHAQPPCHPYRPLPPLRRHLRAHRVRTRRRLGRGRAWRAFEIRSEAIPVRKLVE